MTETGIKARSNRTPVRPAGRNWFRTSRCAQRGEPARAPEALQARRRRAVRGGRAHGSCLPGTGTKSPSPRCSCTPRGRLIDRENPVLNLPPYATNWNNVGGLPSKSYQCGHCDNRVASAVGYFSSGSTGIIVEIIYICPHCARATSFYDGVQLPGAVNAEEAMQFRASLYAFSISSGTLRTLVPGLTPGNCTPS